MEQYQTEINSLTRITGNAVIESLRLGRRSIKLFENYLMKGPEQFAAPPIIIIQWLFVHPLII